MTDSPPWTATIFETSRALARGEVSAEELTLSHLERIAEAETRFHAFAGITADLALNEARAVDAARARGEALGPLSGIPMAIKDAIDDPARPARFGNPVLHKNHPGGPSTVATRLKDAGVVGLGKLILTEGVWVQHHSDYPEPTNPHGADYWTGNSSSGSGVALAAGMVMGSVGTDTGGSIRLPSGSCGVTGLKPTWGRVSVAGVHPLAPSFDHVGPMARTARDTALIMDAIAGPDAADTTCLSIPSPCYTVGDNASVDGLRIGWPAREIEAGDEAVQNAMSNAAETLRNLGAEIVAVEMPDPIPVIEAWSVLISAEAARVHKDTFPAQAELYGTALTDLITRGLSRSAEQIIDAMSLRRTHAGQMAALMSRVDALLIPALPVGGPSNAFMNSFADDNESTQVIGRYTVPFSMTGLPTLTLPCGRNAAGIPVGMQICGPALSEPLLLEIGAAFQDSTEWHGVAAD